AHGTDIFVEKVLLSEKIARALFVRVGTAYNRSYLVRIGPHRAPDIRVMPFGVDVAAMAPAPAAMRPHRDLRLLSVGRLVWQKAQHLLLEACALLRREGTNLHLVIVGEGDERAALESRRAALGLEGVVDLPGAMPEGRILEEYHRADLFVLSS